MPAGMEAGHATHQAGQRGNDAESHDDVASNPTLSLDAEDCQHSSPLMACFSPVYPAALCLGDDRRGGLTYSLL